VILDINITWPWWSQYHFSQSEQHTSALTGLSLHISHLLVSDSAGFSSVAAGWGCVGAAAAIIYQCSIKCWSFLQVNIVWKWSLLREDMNSSTHSVELSKRCDSEWRREQTSCKSSWEIRFVWYRVIPASVLNILGMCQSASINCCRLARVNGPRQPYQAVLDKQCTWWGWSENYFFWVKG
jgi:hypothetical protein